MGTHLIPILFLCVAPFSFFFFFFPVRTFMGTNIFPREANLGMPADFLFSLMKMHRFVVHGFERSRTCRSTWVLSSYTFGNKDPQACRTWIEEINTRIRMDMSRPKSLWVRMY